jgi:hypothetical protein
LSWILGGLVVRLLLIPYVGLATALLMVAGAFPGWLFFDWRIFNGLAQSPGRFGAPGESTPFVGSCVMSGTLQIANNIMAGAMLRYAAAVGAYLPGAQTP